MVSGKLWKKHQLGQLVSHLRFKPNTFWIKVYCFTIPKPASVAESQSPILLARTDVLCQNCYTWHLLSHSYLHGVYDVCGMEGHETRHWGQKWRAWFVVRKCNFGVRDFENFEWLFCSWPWTAIIMTIIKMYHCVHTL